MYTHTYFTYLDAGIKTRMFNNCRMKKQNGMQIWKREKMKSETDSDGRPLRWGLRPNFDSQINEIIIQNFNCSVFRETLSILLHAAYIMRSVHTHTHRHACIVWVRVGPISWGQLVFKKCAAVGGGVRVWRWVNERLTMTNSHWLLPSLLINGIKPITTHSFIPLSPSNLAGCYSFLIVLSAEGLQEITVVYTEVKMQFYLNMWIIIILDHMQISNSLLHACTIKLPHIKRCRHRHSSNKELKN